MRKYLFYLSFLFSIAAVYASQMKQNTDWKTFRYPGFTVDNSWLFFNNLEEECTQEVQSHLENRATMGGSLNQRLAVDITVNEGTTFTLTEVTANLSSATSFSFVFYENNNGIPGTEIQSIAATLTGTESVGTVFGTAIYAYALELASPITFTGGTYWMEIQTNAGYWESTTVGVLGSSYAYYHNNSGGWRDWDALPLPATELVYTLRGVCDVEQQPGNANDFCEDAIAISCGETMTGSTTDATDSGGNSSNDVFYTYTGNGQEQLVTVSLCGSSYDTLLRIFTDCSMSEEIAMNNDSCGTQSEVTFLSNGTTTYVIMVEGNGSDSGDFEINVTCENPGDSGIDGCLNGSQFPSGVIEPNCFGAKQLIHNHSFAGEFSVIAVTQGTQYTFSSSVSTDFITIGSSAGTIILASGTGSVSWTATYNGEVRFYTHTNENCGTQNQHRSTYVQCGDPVEFDDPDFSCFMGEGGISGVESGFATTTTDVLRMADQFTVEPGTEFNVQQIVLNIWSEFDITQAVIKIREDNAGSPGQVLHTVTMAPTTSEIFAHPYGRNAYRLTFDLAEPFDLSEGTYWIDPTASNTQNTMLFWEVTTFGPGGTLQFSHDSGNTWAPDDDLEIDYQAVFYIAGECNEVEEGCLEAIYGAYPSNVVYPSCYGVPTVATAYGSSFDYSLIGLTEGVTYNFSSSYATDFITISDEDGTEVLITGTGAVTWTAPADMVVRFYTHADAECGTDDNWDRVRAVDCGGEPITFDDPDFDCFQGDGSMSSLENGLGVNPEGLYRVADDFIVAADTEFTLQQITINVISGTGITNGTLNIRESNEASAPGEVIETITMAPTTSEVFGNAMGMDFYRLTFDLAEPIEFTEGTYWLEPTFTNADSSTVYWEVTYSGSNGSVAYLSNDLGVTWGPDVYDGSQGIFYVAGECNEVGEETGEDCDITYPGSLEGEGIGGLNIFKWASDFNLAPNSSMSVERVKFNVYSNVASVNIFFLSDDSGVPGTEIVAPMSIVPTSQTLIGTSPSGANIYELVLDLPTAQNFEGGESGTNYWMAVSTVMGSEGLLNFWEFADEINNGTNVYYSITGSTWSNAANAGYPGDAAFILEGTCTGGEEPVDNDDCEGAIAVSCGETVIGTTADATDSGFNPAPDRFYSFTGDGTAQNVTISLCESSFDTYLRVFSDCSMTNEIASNDDSCGSRSRLTFESDGTSTYIIMVEGAGSNSGAYTLSVDCATPLGEPDYACFQGDGLFSNGFEDAYNVSSASDTFRNADDFTVDENSTFTIQYLRLNLFTIVGDNITSAEFNIRADEGGAPSETNIVDTFTAVPTSQTLIGTNFGYDVSQVEFVLDENRPELPAGTYWLEPVVTAGLGLVWWEVTSTGSTGGVVHTSEHGGSWNPDPENRQAVFFVAGECQELGVSDINEFDFTYYPNPVKDVLNISAKKSIENVEIFNLSGQKVLNNAKVSNNRVDVNSLTSGTYIFRVSLEGGQVETFKIIKK